MWPRYQNDSAVHTHTHTRVCVCVCLFESAMMSNYAPAGQCLPRLKVLPCNVVMCIRLHWVDADCCLNEAQHWLLFYRVTNLTSFVICLINVLVMALFFQNEVCYAVGYGWER